mgnify:CR=1 FL=1
MEDIEKEISFIEERLAQLKEQSYQASTPVKQPDKERKTETLVLGNLASLETLDNFKQSHRRMNNMNRASVKKKHSTKACMHPQIKRMSKESKTCMGQIEQ